jgi:hypothetical protein
MAPIDEEILGVLTQRVRVLSIDHVSELAGGAEQKGRLAAARRIARLERSGWVITCIGLAHPELPLLAPIATWRPQEAIPDLGAASYQLRKRWTSPPKPTRCVAASAKAGAFFGGSGGRLPRTSELSHDLCLARVFLRLRQVDFRRSNRWLSEAELYKQGEGRGDKLPDALIVTRAEKTAIEFGGSYSAAKLKAFHEFCWARGWAYEVW